MSALQGVLLASTAIGALLLSFVASEIPEGRDGYFYLPSTAGDVVFNHAGHELKVYACPLCHHEVLRADIEIQSCRNCHPATQAEGESVIACDVCHTFTQEDAEMEHDEMVESHTECATCHHPRDIPTAYHGKCTDCHAKIDREKYLDADGAARCGWCHLQ